MPTKAELAAKKSYEKAQTLAKLHDDPTTRSRKKTHAILPDVSGQTGDHIMAIVAMRIDGNSDTKIGGILDIAQPNISRMETNYPEAFAAAEAHHLSRAAKQYEITLWGVRAAMSKYGIQAVETLHDLMLDAETPHHIRRSCAVDILNLSGAGYTRQSVGGRDTRIHVGEINNIAASLGDKFADDVVDAEVVSEETE